MIVGYTIDEQKDEVIISVPSCPSQEAHGSGGARVIIRESGTGPSSPALSGRSIISICVECLFAPDPPPGKMFCTWRFYLKK